MRLLYILLFVVSAACAQKTIRPSGGEMTRLLKTADTDQDQKITVHDRPVTFHLQCRCGKEIKVEGAYALSNLLQELKLAEEERRADIEIARIYENPVARISRNIRERYWNNLVRRVELRSLAQVLEDSKLPKREHRYLYVPANDARAFEHFATAEKDPALKVKVRRLPQKFGLAYMRTIRDEHGLLYLPRPYVVPGGRFNEQYGWDSYFEALGLIQDGRADLAKDMTDNFVYEIEHYGKILNGNRSYYLNRSQPPFLTSMILATAKALPQDSATDDWRKEVTRAAIKEYREVWHHPSRVTPIGLNRYNGDDFGIPPEVEPGHFDDLLKPIAARRGMTVAALEKSYNAGKIKVPELTEALAHDRAVRESGHDTTYRWRVDGQDRAADFATVDLNSLLYKYEIDLFALTGDREWQARAEKRKELMRKYLWDEQSQMFFDYDWRNGRRSRFVSATAFYPFWAKMLDADTARASLKKLITRLEAPGGLLSNDEASLRLVNAGKTPRQWDYPNGWAPHQMLAWVALKNYGLDEDMNRLTYKWLYMITKNAADFNGTIPEKFDVMKRSHAVFAEYGNVGTDFSYITQEGFGWMNAAYQVGLAALPGGMRRKLEALTPPEDLR